MAASQLLRAVASIASTSLLALTCNSHLPVPPDFDHGLLGDPALGELTAGERLLYLAFAKGQEGVVRLPRGAAL